MVLPATTLRRDLYAERLEAIRHDGVRALFKADRETDSAQGLPSRVAARDLGEHVIPFGWPLKPHQHAKESRLLIGGAKSDEALKGANVFLTTDDDLDERFPIRARPPLVNGMADPKAIKKLRALRNKNGVGISDAEVACRMLLARRRFAKDRRSFAVEEAAEPACHEVGGHC